MKLAIEHVFTGIQPAEFEVLYFDELYNESLGTHLHMGRKLVRLERGANRIVRHVRFEPAQDPDSPVKQAFGTSRASFLEELDYDPRTRRGDWKTIPNMFTERVTNSGTIEFVAAPEGTRRVLRGDVKVKLFGFGGLVEKMIVAEIVKSYDATAAFTREWLAKR
ncbi:MAG TPA: DUF2505 family protein [Kofleriaceae bacterium]|nr:DUF2505 family protein [Kofleriaceae bacterium]